MREIIATGKTVEEATEAGCAELGLTRDEVSVEILEMPQKKLFKTSPAKVKVTADVELALKAEEAAPEKPAAPEKREAALRPQAAAPVQKTATDKAPAAKTAVLQSEPEVAIDLAAEPQVQKAVDYLASIFSAMGLADVAIAALRQGDATLLRVESGSVADKIEVRGEVIQALSYLVDRSINAGVDKKEAQYLRIRLDIAGYRNRRESELVSLACRTGKEVAKTGRSRTLAPMNPYERLIVHTAIGEIEGITSESIGADTERRVVIKSLGPNATDGEDWRPPSRGGNRGGGSQRHEGGGNRGGRPQDRGRSGGGRGPKPQDRGPRTSTPEREFADKARDPQAAPVVPQRREAIRDGEDLPLYGKIKL